MAQTYTLHNKWLRASDTHLPRLHLHDHLCDKSFPALVYPADNTCIAVTDKNDNNRHLYNY